MARRSKFYLISMIFCLSGIFMLGCGGKNKSKNKSKKDTVSQKERKKMRSQVSELQERMEVVMETQQCIVRHCPSSSRSGMNDLNKEVGKADADKIIPAKLNKLVGRVDVAEDIQVGLLKSSCKYCAR